MIINSTPNFCMKVIVSFKINQARNIVITGNVDAITIKIASLTPPEVPIIINKRPAESRKPWIRNINHHFILYLKVKFLLKINIKKTVISPKNLPNHKTFVSNRIKAECCRAINATAYKILENIEIFKILLRLCGVFCENLSNLPEAPIMTTPIITKVIASICKKVGDLPSKIKKQITNTGCAAIMGDTIDILPIARAWKNNKRAIAIKIPCNTPIEIPCMFFHRKKSSKVPLNKRYKVITKELVINIPINEWSDPILCEFWLAIKSAIPKNKALKQPINIEFILIDFLYNYLENC